MNIEFREFMRCKVHIDDLRAVLANHGDLECRIIDISKVGIGLLARNEESAEILVGTRVEVCIEGVEELGAVRTAGRVLRREAGECNTRLGVKFLERCDAAQDLMQRLIRAGKGSGVWIRPNHGLQVAYVHGHFSQATVDDLWALCRDGQVNAVNLAHCTEASAWLDAQALCHETGAIVTACNAAVLGKAVDASALAAPAHK